MPLESMQKRITHFQLDVVSWWRDTFLQSVRSDPQARAYKFLEEAIEFAQAAGVERDDADLMVHYVYGREKGIPFEEAGDAFFTLAVAAEAFGFQLSQAGITRFEYAQENVVQVREADKTKPKIGKRWRKSNERYQNCTDD